MFLTTNSKYFQNLLYIETNCLMSRAVTRSGLLLRSKIIFDYEINIFVTYFFQSYLATLNYFFISFNIK